MVDVKASDQANRDWQFRDGRDVIAHDIDAPQDAQWLTIALSRLGGLRCRSEHLLLVGDCGKSLPNGR